MSLLKIKHADLKHKAHTTLYIKTTFLSKPEIVFCTKHIYCSSTDDLMESENFETRI